MLACRAEVELASVRGSRRVPVRKFFSGPGRTAREGDELIEAVLLPRPEGPQLFTKVGRKAVATLATCSFAVALWPSTRQVLTGVGGADRPAPAAVAEAFLAGQLAAHGTWESGERLPDEVVRHFGELAAEGAVLGDDVRATAEYRRRALSVLARRSLAQAWENYRTGGTDAHEPHRERRTAHAGGGPGEREPAVRAAGAGGAPGHQERL
ncbi:FAD binding domain-containing protein [Streptomyces albus]